MAFIDGYPNYRVLEAITKNLTQDYVDGSRSGLLGILGLIKGLEPFGAGAIVGGTDKFYPEEMAAYYTAYYRNYYFWQSQYQDSRKPNDLTTTLTKLGDVQNPNNRPYPNATV